MTKQSLGLVDELLDNLLEIKKQEENVKELAKEIGCAPFQVRDTNGRFLMMDILLAKSNILNAVAHLSRKD